MAARSWGACLDASTVDRPRLESLSRRAIALGSVRELTPADAEAILRLDASTRLAYPGGIATAHSPLTLATATVSTHRRAFGVERDGDLIAMSFVDLHPDHAETDFTVVAREWRGRGLGQAIKAASVLALLDGGVTRFRTGGSAENAASIASNRAVSYVLDEEWLTFVPPAAG